MTNLSDSTTTRHHELLEANVTYFTDFDVEDFEGDVRKGTIGRGGMGEDGVSG